jgi:alkylated DNA repair dioxygenase AlkB
MERWDLARQSVVTLDPAWLSPAEADAALRALLDEVPWEEHSITIFGKTVAEPRLSTWMGDPDAVYAYSGRTRRPAPWTPAAGALRERVGEAAGQRFNAALLNRYRDGRDAMGFHSDDEPELGPEPCIASLSLGATRTFVLRPRAKKGTTAPLRIALTHGSLLVMRGGTQRHWVHGVPREARVEGTRVNLTFRRIERGIVRPRSG